MLDVPALIAAIGALSSVIAWLGKQYINFLIGQIGDWKAIALASQRDTARLAAAVEEALGVKVPPSTQ